METFDLMTDGILTCGYDQQCRSLIVERKGVELSSADAIPPSSLFCELYDSCDTQRFKNSIVNAASKARQVRLNINAVDNTIFNALAAAYCDVITATGGVDTLRAEIATLSAAKDERYHQIQNTLNVVHENREAQELGFKKQLAAAQTSNVHLANQNSTLKTSNNQMQSASSAKDSLILQLKADLSSAKISNDGYMERIKDLEMQLAVAQTPSVEQTNYVKSLEAETSSMQNKIIQDLKRIQELTLSLKAAETPGNRQEVSALEGRLYSANAANSELELKINSMEEERDAYKAKIEKAKEVFKEQLKMQSGQMKKAVKQKDQEIKSLRSETVNLKAMTVAMQDQNVETVQVEVRRLEGVVKEKDKCTTTLRSEKDKASASLTALQAETEQKSRELDTFQRTVISLQAGHSQKDQSIRTLTSRNDDLETTIATLHTEVKEKHQRLELSSADAELFKNSILSKEEDIQPLEKRIALFSLAIARRDERIGNLETQVNELNASIRSSDDQSQENLIAAYEAMKNSKDQKMNELDHAIDDENIPLVMRKCLLEVYRHEIDGIETFLRRLKAGMDVNEASEIWED